MRNVTVKTQTATSSSYAPSVPLSVYRELAAEMQANQAMLEFLRTQNQQLLQQNQHLRQEIDQFVQSAIRLQQKVEGSEPAIAPTTRINRSPELGESLSSSTPQRPLPRTVPPKPPELKEASPEPLIAEQEEGRYRRPTPPEKSSEINGVWLAVAIFLIVVVTFGASFAIVRPLILKR
ncbi:hypothetical protein QQ054_34845 [Oscillatoria amoena NRMC-F 0135]|nr:hypothetical protein [Geitlerinema splendidum]MDL5051181.1 hypothetical protein [Oscillatoria amoena NRMC-F 0135]